MIKTIECANKFYTMKKQAYLYLLILSSIFLSACIEGNDKNDDNSVILQKELIPETDDKNISIEKLKENFDRVTTISSFDADNADFVTDGIDDQIEINEAIINLYNEGGGLVYLHPGTYYVSSSINVFDNITLKGGGRTEDRLTLIQLIDDAESMSGRAGILRLKKDFESNSEDKRVTNVVLEDFIIDGNRDNQRQDVSDSEKKYGVYSEGDKITFRRITVRNCMGYGFDPHATLDVIPSRSMLIEYNYSYGNYKDGFTLDNLRDSIIRNNLAEKNDRHGFNFVTDSKNIAVLENVSRQNQAVGMMIQNGAGNLTFRENQIYQNGLEGLHLRASNSNLVTDNTITENNRNGLRIRGSEFNLIVGNYIGYNSSEKPSYAELKVQNYINEISQQNVIEGNSFSSITKGAIRELDQSNFNEFRNNEINIAEGLTSISLAGENSHSNNNQISYLPPE